ncbi:N-succinylglutamate 5-semialdehyde dehydrogenase [Novipirellula galeiformis]|uniref:L-glutamate gamma-semialdehyde dehydrogenase n=1 Tax=Novipirellula galeiformis TaxID=2528004 RepID=A0A5C6CNN7_9BACT|nr:aldehyde dehydrogenase family protein [Novipirellula galeiformis]TWU24369.1 N-succinylglutamate 5-semialdehyde dehydrogenase [Novipirellula galeiformis]
MSKLFQSTSPLDDSVVFQGPTSTPQQIAQAFTSAQESTAFWRRTSVSQRIQIALNYAQYLSEHRDEIRTLISQEVGKLPWDADAEVNAAIGKIDLTVTALSQRRSTTLIDERSPRRVVRYHPLGVALVLGPFNFPLHLPGGQIVPALLAGNTIVFKPSDQATAVGAWMVDAWRHAGMPDGVLQMIQGGIETATTAIDSPLLDAVFLTGSRAAGRAIHRQLSGRPEVLLALELGGNNPIVVCDSVPPQAAANLVTFSAFISSGQRCSCARRAILVAGEHSDQQLDAIIAQTQSLRVGLPSDPTMPHVGPLISASAAAGLNQTYDRLLTHGCKPLLPWKVAPQRNNLVHPAIVDATHCSDDELKAIGQWEWFGPLLVIQRVDDFESALRAAANTPYGLAASLVGGNEAMFETFVDRVGAGVVNWNGPTTGAAGSLPFGGLGDSGNHRPAGFHAIDFCSDPVASLQTESQTESFENLDPWNVAK